MPQFAKFTSVLEAVFYYASQTPCKLAVADGSVSYSYDEFAHCICGCALLLQQQGLAPGSKVMIEMDSTASCLAVYYAVIAAGGVAVPISNKLNLPSFTHIQNISKANTLIAADNKFATSLNFINSNELLAKAGHTGAFFNLPDPHALSEILFTSGTTGKSKGVMLNALACIQGGINTDLIGFKSSADVELLTTPLYHAQAHSTLRANFAIGCSSIISSSYISAEVLQNLTERYHINAINIVPTALKLWLEDLGEQQFILLLKALKYCEIGAAVLEEKHKKHLLDLLPNTKFVYNYGATECSRTVFNQISSSHDNFTALGKLTPGVQMKLLNENCTAEVLPGTAGRLAFKGKMVMLGYADNPEATAEVIKDGWYLTKDLAYIKNGFIYLLGRIDDIINLGGEKISPSEIENAVQNCAGITECGCIGVNDVFGILGQIPILFYCKDKDFNENELKECLRSRLDRYKRPRILICLKDLPHNAIGKLDRKKLSELWYEQYENSFKQSMHTGFSLTGQPS